MPQEVKSMGVRSSEGGAGVTPAAASAGSPAGLTVDLDDDAARPEILERAFDFRGDVTLTLADGARVEGYLFDRRRGASPGESTARVMPAVGPVVSVRYADVRRIEFSPRDPAAGKSFETWLKKYVESKRAGLAANIESEPLD